MEREIYRTMAAIEESHWWFSARRIIVRDLLRGLKLPPDAVILEPGCGTGGNFAMLSEFGKVYAMDSDPEACEFSRAKGIASVEQGELPSHIPFGELRPDLVVMTDVLEHLNDDRAALEALNARLRDGGHFVATVPALQWLWSEHDVSHHHRRRYSAPVLRSLMETTGFKIQLLTYYNFILFPLIAGVRIAQRMLPASALRTSDLRAHNPTINGLLLRLFSSERHVIDRWNIPIGSSLLVVATKG
jgi:SAM-dependent methyltransferase